MDKYVDVDAKEEVETKRETEFDNTYSELCKGISGLKETAALLNKKFDLVLRVEPEEVNLSKEQETAAYSSPLADKISSCAMEIKEINKRIKLIINRREI